MNSEGRGASELELCALFPLLLSTFNLEENHKEIIDSRHTAVPRPDTDEGSAIERE